MRIDRVLTKLFHLLVQFCQELLGGAAPIIWLLNKLVYFDFNEIHVFEFLALVCIHDLEYCLALRILFDSDHALTQKIIDCINKLFICELSWPQKLLFSNFISLSKETLSCLRSRYSFKNLNYQRR